MRHSSARSADEIEAIVHRYGNTLYRLCLVILQNEGDAEDAVQDTVIKYMQKAPRFSDLEHEKAWLITVATNTSRDMLRYRKRHPQTELDQLQELPVNDSDSGILEALMALPEKFRMVLTLYYVEEYSIGEIAKIIGRTPSAVKMRLKKGRELLEEKYRKEYL